MEIPARLLNGLLMIALPLGLGVFLARQMGPRWGLYGAGAVTFIASQVLHVPFNAWILNPRLEGLGFGARGLSRELIVSAILLGLSSGVFEEGARYLTLRFWQRQARSWRQALMFGAGHGGAEATIVGILALVAFFQAVAYRGADLAAIVPAEQLAAAEAQIEAYWAAPWTEALLGAVERAFSLVVHLALAVMVMRVFTRRNRLWLAAAIGWHALVNTLAVIGVQTVSAVATEGIVGVMALLSLGLYSFCATKRRILCRSRHDRFRKLSWRWLSRVRSVWRTRAMRIDWKPSRGRSLRRLDRARRGQAQGAAARSA